MGGTDATPLLRDSDLDGATGPEPVDGILPFAHVGLQR